MNSGWILIVQIFAANLSCINSKLLNIEEGSVCNGGTCILVTECRTITDIRKSRPDICSFQGKTPVVCCPSKETTPTTTLSTSTTSKPATQNQLLTSSNNVSILDPNHNNNMFKLPVGEKSRLKCLDYDKIACSGIKNADMRFRRNSFLKDYFHPVVVGGQDSKSKDLTFMALLGYGEKENIEWECGGTLISEYWVLSAAHCNQHFTLGEAKWIRLGELDLSSNNEDATPKDFPIVETVIHPEYGPPPAVYNDIALFKSRWKVQFTDYIKPICLETYAPNLFYKPKAAGWGTIDFGGARSSKLQEVELAFVRTANCSEQYGTSKILPFGINNQRQICAGAPGKDTCTGDSGGPLFQDADYSCLRKQVGITSFGRRCAILPGVYTWVGFYTEWIENIVWSQKDILSPFQMMA